MSLTNQTWELNSFRFKLNIDETTVTTTKAKITNVIDSNSANKIKSFYIITIIYLVFSNFFKNLIN